MAVGCRSQSRSTSSVDNLSARHEMITVDADNTSMKPFAPGIYATVLIETRRMRCSGTVFHRSDDTFSILTNHHCVRNLYRPRQVMQQCSENMTVYFLAFKGFDTVLTKASCIDGSLKSIFPHDVASFKIRSHSPVPAFVKPLKIFTGHITRQQPAYMVHFSKGQTERIKGAGSVRAVPAAFLSFYGCYISPVQKWMRYHGTQVPFVDHTCAASSGSSGAALIHATNHSIIGVNFAGHPYFKINNAASHTTLVRYLTAGRL